MVVQILLSVFLGFLMGLERQSQHKSVGVRTMSLICLGSTLYTFISIHYSNSDPTRVIAQVVSGIGFLGAGIIFKSGSQIIGLTTAATVWCAAAVGLLVGCEMYQEAIVSTLVILFINLTFKYFK